MACYNGYNNYNGGYYCRNSAWNNWVRWLVLGLIILAALFIFFLFRRRMGYSPYPGTAWTLGRTPPGHGAASYTGAQGQTQQPYYNNNNNNNNYAPPAYNAPNNGYYGQDVELQQPSATYGGYGANDNVYKPPKGPPPGRT